MKNYIHLVVCGIFTFVIRTNGVEESDWHMIVGGFRANDFLDEVELFNWKTGEQCRLPNLPVAVVGHTGGVLGGETGSAPIGSESFPIICGGRTAEENYSSRCYTLDKKKYTWTEISSLQTELQFGGSTVVPDVGMFIFGGEQNTLSTSQKLTSVDGIWEKGPKLFKSASDWGQCVLQLSENTTFLLGGNLNSQQVVSFDWTNNNYTEHSEGLKRQRWHSACAILKDPITGTRNIAVAGGVWPNSKGMEVWNLVDGTSRVLTELLPPEQENESSLKQPQLISINDESQLLLYGGESTEFQDEIWKFSNSDMSWTKVGTMLGAKRGHVILPVKGVNCLPAPANKGALFGVTKKYI